MIAIKRIYDEPTDEDGLRILVDRIWPRGLTKEKANLDIWLKEVAPSNTLRKWYKHDPFKWEEFKEKYKEELKTKTQFLDQIKSLEKEHRLISLIYAANTKDHNQALVLQEVLQEMN